MQADRKKIERLLKTARGQLDGILAMVEQDRYCVEISNQIMAAESVLHRANKEVLKAHMRGCVTQAITAGDESKLEEMLGLLEKL